MAKCLATKGDLSSPLLLYNRSIQKAQDLSAALPAGKTEVVSDLKDGAAKADIIFSCLANDAAVRETIESILSSTDVKGKLFVECSTIGPESTEAIGASVIAKGAEYVAAPVFGAPPMAEAGLLLSVQAGPSASIDRARPYFKGVTARAEILFRDESYGKSLMLKLLGNTFIANMVVQTAEAHVTAEKLGMGNQQLHQLLTEIFGGPYGAYSERMLSGSYFKLEEPLFVASGAAKDAGHAMNLVEKAGGHISGLVAAESYLKEVQEFESKRGRKGDLAGIYGAARLRAGLEFDNDE